MNVIRWSLVIAGCLLVLGVLATYKLLDIRASIAAAQAYPEQSETVEEAVVTVAEFTPTIIVIGEVVAPRRLDLRNEIPGEITAVNFRSGERVREGQLLIQLDTAIEEASLQVARARADLAQRVYDRNLELYESRVSNEDQLDRARADLSTTLAEIDVLERTIARKTLRSPFAGRAGLHTFEVGQFLPSNTLIANLVGDTANMWVDFQVPQFYPQLPIGAEVGIAPIGNGSTTAGITASIIAENTVLNAGSRSRSYRASIPDEARYYTPQSMVKLDVPIGSPQRLLQVPALAIQQDPLGQYVFVLREETDGRGLRAIRQQVQVRIVNTDYALLEDGSALAPGDRIATAGAFKLYEGILVFTRERNREYIDPDPGRVQQENR